MSEIIILDFSMLSGSLVTSYSLAYGASKHNEHGIMECGGVWGGKSNFLHVYFINNEVKCSLDNSEAHLQGPRVVRERKRYFFLLIEHNGTELAKNSDQV